MSEKAEETTKAQPTQTEVKKHERPSIGRPRQVEVSVQKSEEQLTFERNFIPKYRENEQFMQMYTDGVALIPPYEFGALAVLREESEVLSSCIQAMRDNIVGFGYDFDRSDKKNVSKMTHDDAEELLSDFFGNVNEDQTMVEISRLFWDDLETFGFAAFEVLMNRKEKPEPAMMYHLPTIDIRVAKYDKDIDEPVDVSVWLPRGSSMVQTKIKKTFRRFVQVNAYTQEVKWFKEYGDPRTLDYAKGTFVESTDKIATCILPFMLPHPNSQVYGLPRYTGAVFDVKGRSSSQFINYDIMESQGIPAMAVLVKGGTLTQESYKELKAIFTAAKGKENFNKMLILEALGAETGIDGTSNVDLEMKNLSDFRAEDQMFEGYQKTARENISRSFRLPPLYTGDSSSYTLATSKSSQIVAEQQIFGPERVSFDNFVNQRIIQQGFGISSVVYRGKGPRVVGSETIASSVEKFANVGALSINDSIVLVNEAFGLTIPKRDEEWASIPVSVLKKLLDAGRELPEINENTIGEVANLEGITGKVDSKEEGV